MSDFKTRLLDEKQQLDEKIEKLTSFLGSDAVGAVDGVQLTLLNVQVKAMETYSQILLERIVRLT